jgi:hypothetical protein
MENAFLVGTTHPHAQHGCIREGSEPYSGSDSESGGPTTVIKARSAIER